MLKEVDGFSWDFGNLAKCQKHGVSRSEIEALFHDEPVVFADPGHSHTEQRLRAIGRTSTGRAILVAFTLREVDGDIFIRPISARYMHRKEVMHYEKS